MYNGSFGSYDRDNIDDPANRISTDEVLIWKMKH